MIGENRVERRSVMITPVYHLKGNMLGMDDEYKGATSTSGPLSLSSGSGLAVKVRRKKKEKSEKLLDHFGNRMTLKTREVRDVRVVRLCKFRGEKWRESRMSYQDEHL